MRPHRGGSHGTGGYIIDNLHTGDKKMGIRRFLVALGDEAYDLIERRKLVGFLVVLFSLSAGIMLAVSPIILVVFYLPYGHIVPGIVLGSVYIYELIGLLRRAWKRAKATG